MHPKQLPFISRIKAIEEAVGLIYGKSETRSMIERICAEARSDIADIVSRRGTTNPVIAVIGPKDAGKSTLCQWLLHNPEDRKRLHAGYGKENATRKTTWIGPEAPKDLDAAYEIEIPIASRDLADLGVTYTLVDVPGFSDDDPSAAAAAKRAFRLSTTVILVSSEERLEDYAILKEMAIRDGVRVLPVVVTSAAEELRNDIEDYGKRIGQTCPKSDVLAPVIVPRLNSMVDEEARREAIDGGRSILIGAMKDLLAREEMNPVILAETRFTRMQEELRRAVGELVSDVQGEYRKFVETEDLVIGEITSALAGSQRQLKAACRLRMLDSIVDRCPPIFFPYRSFLGLLTLAAGAWDRLVLAFLGSLPSLVMTVAQSARNANVLAEKRSSLRHAIGERANALAAERLAPVSQEFLRAVRRRLPEDARDRLLMVPPEPVVAGLGEAESAVASAFEEGITRHAPRARLCFTLGLLSMALWLFLASGPVAVVYRQYFDAWAAGFDGSNAAQGKLANKVEINPAHPMADHAEARVGTVNEVAAAEIPAAVAAGALAGSTPEQKPREGGAGPSWREFPVPSAGMLFATTMLVFTPVFLLAMVSLSLAVTGRRVQRCAAGIFKAIEERLRQLAGEKVLRLEVEDPMRDAIRTLFDEAGRPHRLDHPGGSTAIED